ncbi:hypothetical protein SAMN06273567_10910 [Geodermatophilus aquaeductus]|uniref:Uncharacterized protein n=1 Tax=Geodermatophilus aquaeductus TaxID=1564161 RepID=A0A521FIY2_9ACTN|nr:hypothetical protein SAMN06273567_10910 [Geodermatophilus aquaeductus]
MVLTPTRRDWEQVLRELTTQLADGRLYDCDLASLAQAMATTFAALERRMSLLP